MKKLSLLLLVALLALVACGPAATPTSAPPAANTSAPATSAPPAQPTAGATTGAVQPANTTAATGAIVEGGTFIEGSFADAKTFNSILSSDTTSSRVIKTLGNGLLLVNAQLQPECDLCESFTVSPDNLKITFKLRKGVKFHDGQGLTADDVKFTYDSILSADNASPRRGYLKDVFDKPDSVKVLDPYTIEFNYTKVKADTLVSDLGYAILPKHVLGTSTGKAFTDNDFNTKKPIYTGPFMFKEWVSGDHLTVVANPNYFRGKPHIDSYILKVIPDSSASFAQLKTGEIDYGSLDPAQAADAKKQTNFTTYSFNQFNFDFIAFQLDPAKSTFFQDKKVRQALLLAIDRQAIVDSQYFGYAVLANGPVPPISWAYNKDNSPTYGYDVNKTTQPLDDTAWKAGPDGIRTKDGKRFSITLWTNAGNKIREAIIVAVQQFWKDAGVEVKTQTEEWGAFLKRIGATPDGTHDYDAFLVGFQWGVDPNQKTMWGTDQGFNLNKY